MKCFPMMDRGNKDLILLVGGTPGVRSHLREVLFTAYEVVESRDSTEGFTLAKSLAPQLVIINIDGDGMKDARWCKVLKNDVDTFLIPLVLVYCEGSEDCIIKGFQFGVDECIVRPFNVNILKARIKNLVDNRKQLLYRIRTWELLQPDPPGVIPIDSGFVEQLHDIIEKNLSDPLFSVEKLCKKLDMSRASMYRKIRSLTGESPQLFIRSYRLKRAAQLLENNHGNVTEVCFSVGFTSTAYFTKCFKEKFHHCPKTFARDRSGSRH